MSEVQQQSSQQPRQLLTVPQVAKRLSLGESKVYYLIGDQRLPLPVVRFGRAVRVDPVELDDWLEKWKKLSA